MKIDGGKEINSPLRPPVETAELRKAQPQQDGQHSETGAVHDSVEISPQGRSLHAVQSNRDPSGAVAGGPVSPGSPQAGAFSVLEEPERLQRVRERIHDGVYDAQAVLEALAKAMLEDLGFPPGILHFKSDPEERS